MNVKTGVALILFIATSSAADAGEILKPKDAPVPKVFFGQHMHRAASTTVWPSVPFGAWRLWDARVGWSWIEQRKGEWRLEQLDKLVSLAEQHNVQILLPLGPTPQWASSRPHEPSIYAPGYAAEPKDLADWRNYVRTIATRYKGRIKQYEIWNEPNVKGFFSGSVSHMVALTREAYTVLKEVDPSIVLVSPAATGGYTGPQWLDDFLTQGGGRYCDVIGFHLYVSPAPPETMVPLLARVRAVMKKHGLETRPLWNTEAGWFIQNEQTVVKPEGTGYRSKILSQEEGAAYVARSLLLNWAGGVDRFYWYAWDNEFMGLTEPDGKTVKFPGHAFGTIFEWLQGSRVKVCQSDKQTWTCSLTGGAAGDSWIIWNEGDRPGSLNVREWKVRKLTNLRGETRDIPKTGIIQVGPEPVLLRR